MTDLTLFRVYEPHECGSDGYPHVWHGIEPGELAVEMWQKHLPRPTKPPLGGWGVKHIVRAQAGDRCVRCRHPYRVGESGEWEHKTPVGAATMVGTEHVQGLLDAMDQDLLVKSTRSVLWSECDERCRHGGPMRVMTTEGWHPFHPTPEACGAAVAALRSDYSTSAVAQAAWRILTVHHLNERKFDCRWHNLVALCQRCHLAIQRKVEMNQVWPFEHSDWFKPYAAGYYAYAYLGQELTREETAGRLDELLALERIA